MRLLWIILCFCLWGLQGTRAQCAAENKAMQAGETLTYDLHFNWKFVWVKAGTALMQTTSDWYQGKPALRSYLLTRGNKRADFFFTMRDTLEAVMTSDLVPIYFRKGAEEGKRYTVDEIRFSYSDGMSHISQSRHRRGKEPIFSQHTDSRCIYDMLSLLARARSFDVSGMKVGEKLVYPMATGAAVEEQTLIYRGKENFKADNGTVYRCLVFSLVEYTGEKRKETEVITFYVTDDANHLPVRLDMYLSFGSAKAFLTSVSGNRHPFTSIVEEEKKNR